MITNPAKFVFDSIDHLKSLSSTKEKLSYFNDLIGLVCDLDNETACRIVSHFIKTLSSDTDFIDLKIAFNEGISKKDLSNFIKFHENHGVYLLDSVSFKDKHDKWSKLYTNEDVDK